MTEEKKANSEWKRTVLAGKYEIRTEEGDEITVLYEGDCAKKIESIVIEQPNPKDVPELGRPYPPVPEGTILKPVKRTLRFDRHSARAFTKYESYDVSVACLGSDNEKFWEEVEKYRKCFESLMQMEPSFDSDPILKDFLNEK